MSKGATTTEAVIPEYQKQQQRTLFGAAQAVAQQPFVPYTGARVAGFTPDQLRQFQATRGLFETGMQYDPMSGLAGLAQAPAPSLLEADIGAYQSPYTQQVIETTLGDIRREQDIAQRRAQEQAIRAGAFGGSRSAIMEAEATRPYIQEAARTAAGLRQAGYGQALGAAESDLERQMRTRGFQAGLLGGLQAEQAARLGQLGQIGLQQQALQQAALDVPYLEFQRALGYGPQQIGLLSQALSPTTAGQRQQQDVKSGDILGAAAQLAGAGLMGGAFSAGGAFAGLSDERLKDNIKYIGKSKDGHKIYTWEWNDIAKKLGVDTPTIGVLAQEVMKYMPEAVMKDENGYYRVNYGVL
jgi:hypothetical protein